MAERGTGDLWDRKMQSLTLVPLTGFNPRAARPRPRTRQEHANAIIDNLDRHHAQVRRQIVDDGLQAKPQAFTSETSTHRDIKPDLAAITRTLRARPLEPPAGLKPGAPLPVFSDMDTSTCAPEVKTVIDTMGRLEAYDKHARATKARFERARDFDQPIAEPPRQRPQHPLRAQSAAGMPGQRPNRPTIVPPKGSKSMMDPRSAGSGHGSDSRSAGGAYSGDSDGRRQTTEPGLASRRQSMGYGGEERIEAAGRTAKPPRMTESPVEQELRTPVANMSNSTMIDSSRDPRPQRRRSGAP